MGTSSGDNPGQGNDTSPDNMPPEQRSVMFVSDLVTVLEEGCLRVGRESPLQAAKGTTGHGRYM